MVDEKVVIKIGGMVCAMCVGTLEIALKKLDGVAGVRVNLASEKAHVTYNPRMATLVDLRRIIEETGLPVPWDRGRGGGRKSGEGSS